jgi:hypothetical protein
MKKILITLSILIVSITSFSQEEIEIPKGTNKIILKTELNERENVKLILKVLKDNDFEIIKFDTTIFQIQTSKKNLKRKILSNITYTLNFNLFDKFISVTGKSFNDLSISLYGSGVGVTSNGDSEIVNKGMKGSQDKECFKEMNELCLKIVSQDKIEYTTKN